MIIKNKKEDLLNYLEDTSNYPGKGSLVYLPENRAELLEAIADLKSKHIPFTASAGRTGTTGGCVPKDGAVISLEKLNRIIDIDKDKRLAFVEAGVSLENLEKEANKLKLTLRAAPTESLALIGGVASTAASGVRGFGYGSIRKYLRELEVILSSGRVLKIKRGNSKAKGRCFAKFSLPSYQMPKVKSQAGYFVEDNMDLIDLFIGSEGTLGIISSCSLDLQVMPFSAFDGIIFFSKEPDAFEFIDLIRQMKADDFIRPASLEFFDQNSLQLLRSEHSFIPAAAAAVYFEQEVEDESEEQTLIETWQGLIEKSKADQEVTIFADTPKERKRVFEIRHKLPQIINESLRQSKQVKAASDISLPEDKFRIMYDYYKEAAKGAKLDYLNFGHIGESHLHFNFLPKSEAESKKARKCLKSFCEMAVSLGGTVSAEHGIGKIKKPYLKLMYNQEEIKQMAALKKYFDPDCLLGLDNIFDKDLLPGL